MQKSNYESVVTRASLGKVKEVYLLYFQRYFKGSSLLRTLLALHTKEFGVNIHNAVVIWYVILSKHHNRDENRAF